MTRQSRLVFRVVVGFWLFGWYCNAPGTPGFLHNFVEALRYQLDDPLFPAFMQSARLALALYLTPVFLLLPLVWPTRELARGATVLMASVSFACCLHLETCNDATFVTSFWAALWLGWFVWNGDRHDKRFYAIARGLAHAAIGMVFLGGLVGKLTPEYGSGEAFYRLYFRDNPTWPYPAMRATLSPDSFRSMATWFTRSAVFAETMLALAPVLPTQFVLTLGGVTILSMMVAWTFHLWSVLSCLFGLMVAAELLRRFENAPVAKRPRKPRRRKMPSV